MGSSRHRQGLDPSSGGGHRAVSESAAERGGAVAICGRQFGRARSSAGSSERMTRETWPQSVARLEESAGPGVSTSRTRRWRLADASSRTSYSERPGETGTAGCPLSSREWIPGTCSNRNTTRPPTSNGGWLKRRVSRNRRRPSAVQRVGKVRRQGPDAGGSMESHSQPPRRRIRCSLTIRGAPGRTIG